MLDVLLNHFPITSNFDLSGPTRLTREQFEQLPATADQLWRRRAIHWLEAAINSLPPSEHSITEHRLTPVHTFCKGVYTRELTMPEGSIIVGKRHAQEHIVMVLKGCCTVFTEHGMQDLEAPCMFTSPAGGKRAFVVHEETTLLTIHHTNAETLEGVEADLIIPERPPVSINKANRIEGT
jgi:hypothetical protein